MPFLQADSMNDLIASTLRDLGEMKWTDITTDLQQHYALRELTNKNRVVLEAGYGIQWDLMTRDGGNFAFTAPYSTDNPNVVETLIQAQMPWRHSIASYSIDQREIAMNRSPRRIVDLLKTRRIGSLISQAAGMENAFWGFPTTGDNLTPHGVFYWIVKNATEGFNGGANTGTGSSLVANVNPTTYPRWKNWAAPYTAVSRDDLIKAMRRASKKVGFKPPVDGIATFNTGNQFGYYTTEPVSLQLEDALESQNDNLGNDVASKESMTLFRKVPVSWVPKLDADSTNPVIGINWGVFKTYILRGRWLKEVNIEMMPGQHNVSTVFTNSSFNWICTDRRLNFVISNGTTYPS